VSYGKWKTFKLKKISKNGIKSYKERLEVFIFGCQIHFSLLTYLHLHLSEVLLQKIDFLEEKSRQMKDKLKTKQILGKKKPILEEKNRLYHTIELVRINFTNTKKL
jgi:hypothetical protein